MPAGARLFFGSTCLFSLAFSSIFVFDGILASTAVLGSSVLALGLALKASMRRRWHTQTRDHYGLADQPW